MKQPNILFIMVDQMAGPSLPMYEHSVIKTPKLGSAACGYRLSLCQYGKNA